MTADDLIQRLSQAIFVALFLTTAVRAARRPRRDTIDTALLFGVAGAIVLMSWLVAAGLSSPHPLLGVVSAVLLMALPYLTLRLVDDFAGVPGWLLGLAAGLTVSAVVLIVIPPPLPAPLVLLLVLSFAGFEVYAAVRFVMAALATPGVPRRRMQAAAAGSLGLGLAVLLAGGSAVMPDLQPGLEMAGHLTGLASGLAFAIGFAPPGWLCRAWQEPALRAWLVRGVQLSQLPDRHTLIRELESGTALALGAPHARIERWDEAAGVLRVEHQGQAIDQVLTTTIGGWAFTRQAPIFVANAPRADPAHADLYRAAGALAVLAAPITASAGRWGVLLVYAGRAPIFAEDSLSLLSLLARQSAVILESHALHVEAAQMRAREEAVRLKDDFLSAAAHQLKTPLTALLAQAQLLERQAWREPAAPIDRYGLTRLMEQTRRLTVLVQDLLDGARAEYGRPVLGREPVDLVVLAKAVCARYGSERHLCRVEAEAPVVGSFDRLRLEQVLDNLVDNAITYSPHGGLVCLRIWERRGLGHLIVVDQGIGIPSSDLLHLFERFHRGSNVDDRRFAGLGLGLYLCRSIVELHGGRLWATSPGVGRGSTFHLELPLAEPEQSSPSRVDSAAGADAPPAGADAPPVALNSRVTHD